MLKRKIFLLLNTIMLSVSAVACSDSNKDDDMVFPSQEKYPLTAFALKVGDSYYHAQIDQDAHTVTIGTIEDGNTITGVDYTLMSESATISPDPATFLGLWKKEQQVAVTTDDQKTTTYTIVIPKYNDDLTNLIFFDDFDKGDKPNESFWKLCPKGSSEWNEEMSESYEQAYLKDGNLVLVGEKGEDGNYKAGGIKTDGKFSFTFGRVEVRARITKYPNGAFPAIWLMPQVADPDYTGWPAAGEIDIMEHVKQETTIHHTIHTHYTYELGYTSNPANTANVSYKIDDYNVYGLEWTSEALTFYVNGTKTFTYPNKHLSNEATMKQWPFTDKSSFYLILNMGLGSSKPGSWPGPINDAALPAIMEVDWVKVYKQNK